MLTGRRVLNDELDNEHLDEEQLDEEQFDEEQFDDRVAKRQSYCGQGTRLRDCGTTSPHLTRTDITRHRT